jgi:hypothetical protein
MNVKRISFIHQRKNRNTNDTQCKQHIERRYKVTNDNSQLVKHNMDKNYIHNDVTRYNYTVVYVSKHADTGRREITLCFEHILLYNTYKWIGYKFLQLNYPLQG